MKHSDGKLTNSRVALGLLLLGFAFNFADRSIINTLGEAIKTDLSLTDTELGLLGGLSFALLYSVTGIPIARLSDRHSRVNILSTAIAFWSLATGLCALASSYWSLFLMRVGVGIGEAGCSPPSQSLISDYFPPEKRSTAISILYLGVPLGVLVGSISAGAIAESLGWRWAFLIIGTPGVLLAVAIRLILKEPPRGRFEADAEASQPVEIESLLQVLRFFWNRGGLKHIALGVMLASMGGYAFGQFLHPLLVRHYELGYTEAAGVYGLIGAISVGIGSPLGGFLTDRFSVKNQAWAAWIPAAGLFLAAPLYVLALAQSSWSMLLIILIIAGIGHNFYHGPAFAAVHNRVPARMRATCTAFIIFLSASIGLGLGPLLTGIVSDWFASTLYSGQGSYFASCVSADTATTVSTNCLEASSSGLRYALGLVTLSLNAWSALHFYFAGRAFEPRRGHCQRNQS